MIHTIAYHFVLNCEMINKTFCRNLLVARMALRSGGPQTRATGVRPCEYSTSGLPVSVEMLELQNKKVKLLNGNKSSEALTNSFGNGDTLTLRNSNCQYHQFF